MTREQITFRREMLLAAMDCAIKAQGIRRRAWRKALTGLAAGLVCLVCATVIGTSGGGGFEAVFFVALFGCGFMAGLLEFWAHQEGGAAHSEELLTLREEVLDDMAEILAFMELGRGLDASHEPAPPKRSGEGEEGDQDL